MTITFENNISNSLKPGIHQVKISRIYHGESSIKKTPYFKCRFENEHGYIYQRFHVTNNSKLLIKRFFEAAGIYDNTVDTNNLLGKELLITISSKDQFDIYTGEIINSRNECTFFECIPYLKKVV